MATSDLPSVVIFIPHEFSSSFSGASKKDSRGGLESTRTASLPFFFDWLPISGDGRVSFTPFQRTAVPFQTATGHVFFMKSLGRLKFTETRSPSAQAVDET